jgi:hypothetical protein
MISNEISYVTATTVNKQILLLVALFYQFKSTVENSLDQYRYLIISKKIFLLLIIGCCMIQITVAWKIL